MVYRNKGSRYLCNLLHSNHASFGYSISNGSLIGFFFKNDWSVYCYISLNKNLLFVLCWLVFFCQNGVFLVMCDWLGVWCYRTKMLAT